VQSASARRLPFLIGLFLLLLALLLALSLWSLCSFASILASLLSLSLSLSRFHHHFPCNLFKVLFRMRFVHFASASHDDAVHCIFRNLHGDKSATSGCHSDTFARLALFFTNPLPRLSSCFNLASLSLRKTDDKLHNHLCSGPNLELFARSQSP
jgi:hypothetical protein